MSMPIGATTAPPPKKWTILYYLDGKNNLSPMAAHSFDALDQVGSDDNVNLVTQLGLPKKNVMQGLIEKGGGTAMLAEVGEKDMGSADNLKDFIKWGMKNYPAEHYALVMWDHGAGFKGSMVDDETNHMITNQELAGALNSVNQETGHKIDVLNWNACLMQQAEVGYELRNSARYMVGSEEVEAGLRIPLPGVFGTTPQHEVAKDVKEACQTKGDLTPEEMAKLFVFEAKNQFGSSMFTPTQSAIDLSKMDNVAKNIDGLAGALLDAIDADPKMLDHIRGNVKSAQHFLAADMYIEPYVDYRDLGDFCRVVEKDPKLNAVNPKVGEAARSLMASLQDAIVAEQHAPISTFGGRSLEGASGMSIYLPRDYGFDKIGKSSIDGIQNGGTHGHEKTALAKDTRWEALITKISKDDDWRGKMPGQRALMNFGQVAGFYGYQYAYMAAIGTKSVMSLTSLNNWNIFPMMGAIPFLPVPGALAAGLGAVGAAVRIQKGASKIAEGIRRTDSSAGRRMELGVQGALDVAIGVGSVAVCAALTGAFTFPQLAPLGAGIVALGVGRMAVGVGRGLLKRHQVANMTVEDKLANIPSGPQFKALKNHPPAAAAEPAAKASVQPPVAATVIAARQA